jgi:rhodanese-related sulfurtransferase
MRYDFNPFPTVCQAMSFIQENWMLFVVLFLSGGMLLWPMLQRRFSTMKDVGNLQATQLINSGNAALLDVRETKEYEGGRLPNAIHIPLSQLGARGPELAKLAGRPLVVYCARGTRSRMAAGALEKQGFKDLYNLVGGFNAWQSAGLPVER